MKSHDLNHFESCVLINERDSKEKALIKMLSNEIQKKPLEKCVQQHALRNIYKHHVLSEITNGQCVQQRTHLIRQCSFDHCKKSLFQEPKPRCTLTRKVTIKLVEHDGKTYIVPECDCKCIERERQI